MLDGAEAAAGRGLESVEERTFGEEVAQVGGETGHGGVMILEWGPPVCVDARPDECRVGLGLLGGRLALAGLEGRRVMNA